MHQAPCTESLFILCSERSVTISPVRTAPKLHNTERSAINYLSRTSMSMNISINMSMSMSMTHNLYI